MAVYCFAVIESERSLPLMTQGSDQAPVRLVPLDGLAAVVTDLEADRPLDAAHLRRHMAVVDQLFASGPVLPFRFGVAAPDEAQLRRQLAARLDFLKDALQRLRGRVEFDLTVRFDEAAVLRSLLAERPALRELSRASRDSRALAPTLELGEAVYQELERRKEVEAAQVAARLEPRAEAVARRSTTGDAVLRSALLMAAAEQSAFEQTLQQVAAERPWLRIDCVGPMPPYSFVEPPTWD